jgi:hypothetical protein
VDTNQILNKYIREGKAALRSMPYEDTKALEIARDACRNLTPTERNILANEIKN